MLLFQSLVDLSALVDELLLALNLGSMSVEVTVFLADLVGGGLEALVHPPVNLSLSLTLALVFQVGHPLEHFFADLFRRLEVLLELYGILGVFNSEHGCKSVTSFLKSGLLPCFQGGEFGLDKMLLNHLVSFGLPMGPMVHVLVLCE